MKRIVISLIAIVFCSMLSGLSGLSGRLCAAVPVSEAEEFGRLLVQSSSGRIGPVDTYSSEIFRKIYRKDSYGELTASQMVLELMANPRKWSSEPIIYVSDKGLRERFGAKGKHIAYESLFDKQGNYILSREMETIYAKSPQQMNKTDKELVKLDEKVSILYSLFSGKMMKIFPAADNGWFSAGDDLSSLEGKDSLFVARAMPWYLGALQDGDLTQAAQVRGMISTYQEAKVPQGLISRQKLNAELLYNKVDVFRWAFRFYLILGVTLLISSFTVKDKNKFIIPLIGIMIGTVFLWQTFGMGLRWYISGTPPWTNAYESMVYVAWTAVLAGLIFIRRLPLATALGAIMGGVILFVSNLSWLDPQITPLVPVLKSPWLMIHVSVIIASYGFFGICALTGMVSLGMLLRGKFNEDLRRVNEISMIIGLILLTAGIFFGAVWANQSWGRYWGWDPKETWALVTMIVYAFITHSRFIPKLNNYFAFNAMSVAAIYTVLMTFFGVNYYLSGLHSYGTTSGLSAIPVLIITFALALLVVAAGIKYRKVRD